MRPAVHGYMALFHDLQQRRLRLAGRAVDLVGQQQIRHDRAGLIDQLSGVLIVDRKADDVRRHGIGGELHAARFQSQHTRKRHGRRRFSDTRHVLHQDMAARQNRHQDTLHDLVLANDHGFDLV